MNDIDLNEQELRDLLFPLLDEIDEEEQAGNHDRAEELRRLAGKLVRYLENMGSVPKIADAT